MARAASTPPPKQSAKLTPEQMRAGVSRLQRRISELEQFDVRKITREYPPEAQALQAAIDETLSKIFGHGSLEYDRYRSEVDPGSTISFEGGLSIDKVREFLTAGKERTLVLLRQAVHSLEEDLEEQSPAPRVRTLSRVNESPLVSELREYEARLSGILQRFTRNRDGIHIGENDDAPFRQIVRELIDLFNDTLGSNNISPQIAQEFNEGVSNFVGSPSYHSVETILGLVRAALTRFTRSPQLLNRSARQEQQSDSIMINRISKEAIASRKIFVVHGHGKREHEVARYLEHLKFKPIILHEQANQGRTVIEKFEAHSDVGFAVVLLTPDDVGRAADASADQIKYRARQNVILELGYFLGRLGRDRVCALMEGDIELPSDILGVVWEPLDSGGAWKQRLVQELKAAKYAEQ